MRGRFRLQTVAESTIGLQEPRTCTRRSVGGGGTILHFRVKGAGRLVLMGVVLVNLHATARLGPAARGAHRLGTRPRNEKADFR